MADLFDQLDAATAAAEGGYVNNPKDRGGETNHGITVAVARANGYAGAMRDMTAEQAKAIRRSIYWARPGFYLVAKLDQAIARELYDTGVNMGPGTAALFLQKALNALNREGRDYPDVAEDGAIGPATAHALDLYLQKRGRAGVTIMLKALNCLQGARYIELARAREANEEFVFGWLGQRVGLGA